MTTNLSDKSVPHPFTVQISSMPRFDLIATATFGLENVVARELEDLGYQDCRVTDGRVVFSGDETDIARCNLWLRSADRILIRVGEFHAADFGALFDQVTELPWADLLPVDAQFPVKGRSVRSKLHAVPKVQGVTKKAIVESLKKTHNRFRFEESGAEFVIEVSLLKDVATLTIDTTGAGLHKRGYRQVVGQAPLRETMAAGLVMLSFWNPERPLIDPFCGSGTIPIEAALIGRNIAPGLQRSFAAEDWNWFDRKIWKEARTAARDARRKNLPAPIMAYDHDPDALRHARRCATDAGVGGSIRFNCQEASDLRSPLEYGCIVTNPPYGERMGDNEQVEAVYRIMGDVFSRLDTWSIYVLTSYRGFEHHFGKRAGRRRKLYNGRLECQYYQYPGPRPPQSESDSDTPREFDSTETPATHDAEVTQKTSQTPDTPEKPNPWKKWRPAAATTTPVIQASTQDPQTPNAPRPPASPAPFNPFETFVAECGTPGEKTTDTDTANE